MEFLLNGKKYQISDMEVFIDYLIAESYFKDSKYDIHFDFLDDFEGKLDFEDLKRGGELVSELNINFINPHFIIKQHLNGNFRISYHDISFVNVDVGEAIPVLIVLDTLLSYRPVLSLDEIKSQVDNFIIVQREKFIKD